MTEHDLDIADHEQSVGDDINERELRRLEEHVQAHAALQPQADSHAEHVATHAAFAPLFEVHEPDPQELAGALFAQLGYVVADIGEAETMAVIVDGDRETLALDLHKLDNALQQLGVIRDEIAQALAALMENELEAIAGFAVKRTRSDKVEWDRESAWQQVRAAIIERWAMAGASVIAADAQLVDRVIHDIKTVYTSANPTVKGLQALAVNPYELRSTTPATRWTVRVTA